MDYDAWLFTGERDEEEEAEIEARRKFYEEQRQEQEDDRNYWDWQWVGTRSLDWVVETGSAGDADSDGWWLPCGYDCW